ncbi:hypothetical protein CgIS1_08195 [Frankia sp. CgS1]|nr:hypothetical protein Manayef4_11325 [Frankia sp. CgIM4]OHV57009.1 hypothetical protein CgIS1_08195 [Frankia sp. CgIS1]
MPTRCCWPPESSCGQRRAIVAGAGSRTAPSSSTARDRASARDSPASRQASATCAPTRTVGSRLLLVPWWTIAKASARHRLRSRADRARTSIPSSTMRPASMAPPPGSTSASAAASVLLPHPDSPTRP